MAALSKNMYTNKLDEVVDKYNKTFRTIKMKPAGVKPDTYTDYGVEHNEKNPKFRDVDHARISK